MVDFMSPVKNARLTSKFGWRNIGFGKEWHQGIDLASTGKVPIFASAAGIVTRAQAFSSYGNVVMIRHTIHGKTYETNYAHLVFIYTSKYTMVYGKRDNQMPLIL